MFITRSLIISLLCIWAVSSYAQTYNPFVNQGTINPGPMLPAEFNGTGTISFMVGNSGTSALPLVVNQEMTLVLTLANGIPDNANPIAALSGAWVSYFNWYYNPAIKTYFAIQNKDIPPNNSGIITIGYKVTNNTPLTVSGNGFNLNLQPPPYANGSNLSLDDATNGYTYVQATDYGDAPLSYGSASSEINLFKNQSTGNYINFVMLGDTIDHDLGYLSSVLADGDDSDGIDDEDGVTFPTLIQGTTVTIPVVTTVRGGAYHVLNAWIDWNGDGDFNDPGEQIASNISVFSTQTTNLTVSIPANSVSGITFARFRFGSTSGPTGFASYGEVEDYMIDIIDSNPSIVLVKTGTYQDLAPLGVYNAGDQISYTFTVTNTGNVPLINVSISDPLVTVSGGPLDILNPGQSDNSTFTAIYTLTQADIDAGIFTNTATAMSTFAGLPVSDDDDDTKTFIQTPSLSMVKTATLINGVVPVPFVFDTAGDLISYSFVVTNTGNVTLTNVRINDALTGSVDLAVVPSTLAPGATGTVTATYIVLQSDIDAGSVLNTATASGTFNAVDYLDDDDERVWANQLAAIEIVKTSTTDPNTYSQVGDILTYNLVVTNTGNVTLTDIDVIDPVATVDGSPIAILVPGASETITASYVVTQTDLDNGQFVNTATATGNYTDENGAPQTESDDDIETITATQLAAIQIEKTSTTAPNTYSQVGDLLTYNLEVTNTGNVTLTDIDVSDPVATVDGSPIAILVPGASETIKASYVVTQTDLDNGQFINTATATGNYTDENGDPQTESDDDIETIKATQLAAIQIEKTSTLNPDRYSYVGDILTYDLEVTNTGNITLTNIDVSDPAATVDGSPIAILVPGASETITASYVVTQTDLDNGQFVNIATATGNYTDDNGAPQSVSDEDSETVLAQIPDVTPVITAIPNVMQGLTEFNLTVRVTELNNIDTKGLIIIKVLKDARLSFKDPYNSALTILGTLPLKNTEWTFSEDETHYIFSSNTVIPAGSFSAFGFVAIFDPGNTKGNYILTSQIISGSGGEIRIDNNVDSEKIDYFIE